MADRKVNILIAAVDVECAKAVATKLLGEDTTVDDVFTIHRCVELRNVLKQSICMLKGTEDAGADSGTECDVSDASLDGTWTKGRQSKERLSSTTDSQSCTQHSASCESRAQEKSLGSEVSVAADVCIVLVGISPSSFIPSFVFAISKPGILVVPFRKNTLNRDRILMVDTIKEIGQRWKENNGTFLLLVDISHTDSDEFQMSGDAEREECLAEIRSDLFNTHFDQYMDSCLSHELNDAITKLITTENVIATEMTESHKNLAEMWKKHANNSTFLENQKIELFTISTSEDLLHDMYTDCFEFRSKKYAYRKESVINKFHSFTKKLPVSTYCSELSKVFSSLDQHSRLYIEAFAKENLVHIEKKNVYLCPCLDSRNLNPCGEFDQFAPVTSILRLTVESECVPGILATNVLTILATKDWKVYSWDIPYFKYAYFLSKNCLGLKLTFGLVDTDCRVHLQIVTQKRKSEPKDLGILCEELRCDIEQMMKKYCKAHDIKQYVNRSSSEWMDTADDCNWENVEELSGSKERLFKGAANLLTHWFPSKVRELDVDVGGKVESFLAELSAIFGTEYYLFFISQGIPSSTIDKYREENKDVTRVVFLLLKDWWKQKSQGSVANLRNVIMNSDMSKISVSKFDEIVSKHLVEK